eukprot:1965744-Prymnesium_polylepis.2
MEAAARPAPFPLGLRYCGSADDGRVILQCPRPKECGIDCLHLPRHGGHAPAQAGTVSGFAPNCGCTAQRLCCRRTERGARVSTLARGGTAWNRRPTALQHRADPRTALQRPSHLRRSARRRERACARAWRQARRGAVTSCSEMLVARARAPLAASAALAAAGMSTPNVAARATHGRSTWTTMPRGCEARPFSWGKSSRHGDASRVPRLASHADTCRCRRSVSVVRLRITLCAPAAARVWECGEC